jgi:hypothetical protein
MSVFLISCGVLVVWLAVFLAFSRGARDQLLRDFFGRR